MQGSVMQMRALTALDLPVGKAVELKPGGYHVMLFDLKQQIKAGDSLPLTLVVVDAGGKRRDVEGAGEGSPARRALARTGAGPAGGSPAINASSSRSNSSQANSVAAEVEGSGSPRSARPRCIEAASAKSSSIASQKIFQLRLQGARPRAGHGRPRAPASSWRSGAARNAVGGVMLEAVNVVVFPEQECRGEEEIHDVAVPAEQLPAHRSGCGFAERALWQHDPLVPAERLLLDQVVVEQVGDRRPVRVLEVVALEIGVEHQLPVRRLDEAALVRAGGTQRRSRAARAPLAAARSSRPSRTRSWPPGSPTPGRSALPPAARLATRRVAARAGSRPRVAGRRGRRGSRRSSCGTGRRSGCGRGRLRLRRRRPSRDAGRR